MSALHKFVFDGLPVRGMLVQIDDDWQEVLRRRGTRESWPPEVVSLVGQMCAAGVLMHANIKFDGALTLQIAGDGPVPLAVAEVQADLRFRATATLQGSVPAGAGLDALVNSRRRGRCAITLDPQGQGRQRYQGIVALHGDRGEPLERLADVLEHYMLQSEQLDTRLVLAADATRAAGLLVQRMPAAGEGGARDESRIGHDEDFNRIAHLSATLTEAELLTQDASTLLHRLYWQERLMLFAPPRVPAFACRCSRERVRAMLLGLGRAECESLVAERAIVEVGCEFCGLQYRFDAVDVGGLFTPPGDQAPGSMQVN